MILRAIAIAGICLTAGTAAAQDSATLADLRQQLQQLKTEVQSLRTELVASGAAGFQAAGGDSAIDRMNAMEAQLSQLTGKTEQLQNQIRRVVDDGTNRIADLEFRLCEMDETCDLGALMTVPQLGSISQGGGVSVGTVGPRAGLSTEAGDPAVKQPTAAEQQDFDHAQEVLGKGDFEQAARLFGDLATTHAGGPLTSEALFLRGSALDSAGQPQMAAEAWLEGFAADPNGPRAGESLLGLARLVADQGDAVAACLYLTEIPVRFGGSDTANEAQRRMEELDCGAGELPAADTDPDALESMVFHE